VLAGQAGLIADRVESRRLLVWASLAAAAACCGLAAVDGLGPILALTVLLGCANAVSHPAEFALVPVVAGEERLAAANGHVEAARYVGFALGPVLGGVLAAGAGTSLAMLVNAGAFVVLASGAAAIRARRAGPPDSAVATERARDGIAFLVSDPALSLVMAVAAVSLLFMTASWTAEVPFAMDVLRVGELGYGAIIGVWTVGMAIGALGVGRRMPAAALVGGALVAVVVQGAGLALPTLWLVLPLALGAALVGGLGHGAKNVLIRTLIHERVPAHLRGRAYAAYNGVRNAAELAALTGGGLLVAAIGPRATLLLAGLLPVLAGLTALSWHRRRVAVRLPLAPEAA
jgi:MFS family permease